MYLPFVRGLMGETIMRSLAHRLYPHLLNFWGPFLRPAKYASLNRRGWGEGFVAAICW